MGSAPLPLAPKKLFHWVLAYFTAKKHFHSWNGENVADEGNEGVDCVKRKNSLKYEVSSIGYNVLTSDSKSQQSFLAQ